MPASSSTKSSDASPPSNPAVTQAARRTFQNQPSLPLERPGADTGGPLQDQRRLAGAFFIKTERIRPDPKQPRKTLDSEAQAELTDSIKRFGILQPITVRFVADQETYLVISGERRYQASLAAGLAEIPCWIKTPRNEDILLQQIAENWQRRDLEPLELAEALAILRDSQGYNQKQLAAMLSKPESEISRLLSLLKLEPVVQQAARSEPKGIFTKRHLSSIAQLPPEDQQEIMITVRDRKLTAVDTERFVQDAKDRRRGIKTRGAPHGQRLRYLTELATAVLTFRRRNVTVDDILTALDEVREQVLKGSPTGSK